MDYDVARLPWTDEQWAAVQRIVQESARKARVASSFLPLVGPLAPGQASVPALRMNTAALDKGQRGEAAQRLQIDDGDTLKLTTIACEVYLSTQQVEDPELASAKQMLGRAAELIGRLEDAIVFRGQDGPSTPSPLPAALPPVFAVQGGQENKGLLDEEHTSRDVSREDTGEVNSEDLVSQVVGAVATIEGNGHYGPFACVLGHGLYDAATTPNAALVLPTDRITPFLDGGPLRRSSMVPPNQGVVVSLTGSAVDLVVASDVHVKFVQLTLEPRYVLRVSERFVLRIKQPKAICRLVVPEPS